MANELRVRGNHAAGALDVALTTTTTSMSSPGLADLPAVGATEHAAVTLFTRNSDGRVTAKEVLYVTAHTAAATTATIVRGREGTSDPGTTWAVGTKWVHAPTAKDYDGSAGGSGLIGLTKYHPASPVTTSQSGAGPVVIDGTNLIVPFIAPPSGKVLAVFSTRVVTGASGGMDWAVFEGGSLVAGTQQIVSYGSSGFGGNRCMLRALITGLTPGSSHTYQWAHLSVAAVGSTAYGGTAAGEPGQALMEIWAVNI